MTSPNHEDNRDSGDMIVEIERSQWNEALELVKEVFMEFEAPDYPEEGVAEFMNAIGNDAYLDMHRFFGAFEDGQLVGVIATRNEHHHIGLLFVGREHQRKGIGRRLVQHVLNLKDDAPITVNAAPFGHGFYKSLGFVDTSGEQVTNGLTYYPMVLYD